MIIQDIIHFSPFLSQADILSANKTLKLNVWYQLIWIIFLIIFIMLFHNFIKCDMDLIALEIMSVYWWIIWILKLFKRLVTLQFPLVYCLWQKKNSTVVSAQKIRLVHSKQVISFYFCKDWRIDEVKLSHL